MMDKEYQTVEINLISDYISNCMEYIKDNKGKPVKLILTAPCRGGKTRIFAKSVRKVQNRHGNIITVGTTINSMPHQLYANLKKVYSDMGATDMNPMLSKDIRNDGILDPGDFLVLGWPEINKDSNKLRRFDENWNNLNTIFAKARDNGFIIIQIIDEAHLCAQTSKSKEIISDIVKPHILLEVTATKLKNMDAYERHFNIPYRKVAKEGLVKKDLIVNVGRDKKFKSTKVINSDESMLDDMMDCRDMVEEEYKGIGVDCSPLGVVLCKNGNEDELYNMREFCGKRMGERAVGTYLADCKETLSGKQISIEDLNNDKLIKIVFAKQALATAWDCPRAEVMGVSRSLIPGSAFAPQAISRVLSTYGAKHYDNEIVDRAYIFSNVDGLEQLIKDSLIFKDSTPISSANVQACKKYKDTMWDLHNSYILRDEKQHRIGGFWAIFKNETKKYDLRGKIDKEDMVVRHMLPGEYKILVESVLSPLSCSEDSVPDVKKESKITDNKIDIDIVFKKWVKERIVGWQQSSGFKEIKGALYRFGEEMGVLRYNDKIQRIVLSDKNNHHFKTVIESAIEEYRLNVQGKKEKIVDHSGEYMKEIAMVKGLRTIKTLTRRMPSWNPLQVRNFKSSTILTSEYKKCYYDQCEEVTNKLELRCIEFLETYNSIFVWVKQPDSKSRSFWGVVYEYEGVLHTFYPDFIFMLKNSDIIIIDTKAGDWDDESYKACALQAFFVKENIRRKKIGLGKVSGGIVDYDKQNRMLKIYTESDISKYQHNSKDNNLSNFQNFSEFLGKMQESEMELCII